MFGRNRQLQLVLEAMEKGADIAARNFELGVSSTLRALERDGRILTERNEDEVEGPVILDDFEEEHETSANLEDVLPDVLEEGAKKCAEQIFSRAKGED